MHKTHIHTRLRDASNVVLYFQLIFHCDIRFVILLLHYMCKSLKENGVIWLQQKFVWIDIQSIISLGVEPICNFIKKVIQMIVLPNSVTFIKTITDWFETDEAKVFIQLRFSLEVQVSKIIGLNPKSGRKFHSFKCQSHNQNTMSNANRSDVIICLCAIFSLHMH